MYGIGSGIVGEYRLSVSSFNFKEQESFYSENEFQILDEQYT